MDSPPPLDAASRLHQALLASAPSVRLQAAMSAGTHPRPEYVSVLLERCAIEPDLNVRETLTWALMRHPVELTVPTLITETRSAIAQARSQALHTLSKIGDPEGWAAITPEVLNDTDDQVARTAWRVATVLVPEGGEHALAAMLVRHLNHGDRDVQLSLSRALVALGDTALPVLEAAAESGDERRRVHAIATMLLRESPDEGFDAALFDAELRVLLSTPLDSPAEPNSGHDPDTDSRPDDS
ncbi:HEAT repeat domain-containing protein [Rhodoglobus sp.]